MCARLSDRLGAMRRAMFVGRAVEKEIFAQTLADSSFALLHIYGTGGVGKTTLLREMCALCSPTETRILWLDAREIEPSPESFSGALSSHLKLGENQSPIEFLATSSTRCVLFIDTYELLTPLDNWLRETFLPQLPDDAIVVFAGRNAPRPAWRIDGAWSAFLHVLPLQNFNDSDGATFLQNRHVPQHQQHRLLEWTHGHPLALSLVADVFDQRSPGDARPFELAEAPDIVRLLVEHLVQEVPSFRHRLALEACALMRWTNEALLAHLLDLPSENDESAALFGWLQSLSFIENGVAGLSPHDMAREAIVANLRWRNADLYADLHRRARSFYATQLQNASPANQQRILADYIFLHHDNSVLRPFLEWQENSDMSAGRATPEDLPFLVETVRRHEGEKAAQIAAHWFALQPERVLVLREGALRAGALREGALREGARIAGFLFSLALHKTTEAEREVDDIAKNAWHLLQNRAPLQPGEDATMFRFWMSCEEYQGVSGAQSLVFINIVRHYLTNQKLALSFLVCADPDFWAPVFAYAGATRFEELATENDGQTFGVYGHDWREIPPMMWLDILGEREIIAAASARDLEKLQSLKNAESLQESSAQSEDRVLDVGDFAIAVRAALKNLQRPAALCGSVLLDSKIVTIHGASTSTEKIAALQKVLRESCENLNASGRRQLFYEALRLTYLEPALTQEAAATQMDVPFSSYRRYLKEGLERVTEELWQRENSGQ